MSEHKIKCPECGEDSKRDEKLTETYRIFEVIYPVRTVYSCKNNHGTLIKRRDEDG